MRYTHLLCTVLMAMFLALNATADVIKLKNGTTMEGRVIREDAQLVVIQTAFGRQDVPRDRIKELSKKPWTVGLAREKLDRVKPQDQTELLRIRAWFAALEGGERRKVKAEEKRLAKLILAGTPNDPAARKLLGYVKIEDRWLRGGALKKYREKHAAELAAAKQAKVAAAARLAAEKKEAERYGGASLRVQFAENRKEDEGATTELTDLLGQPCASATTRRVLVRGLLAPEIAREMAGNAEEFLTSLQKKMGLDGNRSVFTYGAKQRYNFFVASNQTMAKAYDHLVPQYCPRLQKAVRALILDNNTDLYPTAAGCLAIHRKGNGNLQDVFFHFLGHAYVCSLTNDFYPWLVEGFGLWFSDQNVGVMQMACITVSRYAEKRELKRLDRQGYAEILKAALPNHNDTVLISLMRKPLNSLKLVDIAKSWSIVDYLMTPKRAPKFKEFLQSLNRKEPAEATMEKTLKMKPAELDEAWRKWFLDKFK